MRSKWTPCAPYRLQNRNVRFPMLKSVKASCREGRGWSTVFTCSWTMEEWIVFRAANISKLFEQEICTSRVFVSVRGCIFHRCKDGLKGIISQAQSPQSFKQMWKIILLLICCSVRVACLSGHLIDGPDWQAFQPKHWECNDGVLSILAEPQVGLLLSTVNS